MKGRTERLEGHGIAWSDHDEILVTTPDGLRPRTFFEIAQAQNVQIRHFYAKKDTLEDIFLKVLEDEPDQNVESGTSQTK